MNEGEHVHGPQDVPAEAAEAQPGVYPYRRGIHAQMYRQKLWTMRQYSGYGGPRQTNQRFKQIIASGGTGLSLAFDLPTQLGLDSDHELARGEVGRTGVAIDTVDDMAAVFDGIDLSQIGTSMTINAPAAVLWVFYMLVGQRHGVAPPALRGTVQNDILKEYIARGTFIYPLEPSLRLISDLFEYCGQHTPKFNVISVSGYHIREAGATAVQELAFTLANACVYVQKLLDSGQDVNRVGRQISFFFSVDNGFLQEAAKFRAARVLWARIMHERFGADVDASRLRFHCQTAGSSLTAQQPDNNVVRVALQAMSAVLGGTQSLHTNARDEALGLPTDSAAQLALRTQQIIACETNITDYVDPLAGSYAVEALTRQYIDQATDLISQIDRHGGMKTAVESGLIKRWIQDAAYQRQLGIENGSIPIVAVNCHQHDDQPVAQDVLQLDPAVEASATEQVRKHRAARDEKAWSKSLQTLSAAARGSENLIPGIEDAAQAGATVGEISGELQKMFGSYQPAAI